VFVLAVLNISWLINKRFKKIFFEYLGIIVAFISVFIFSGLLFGSMACWVNWFKSMIGVPHNIITVELGNFSPAMLVLDKFNIDLVNYFTIIFIGIAVLLIWIDRRKGKDTEQHFERKFLEDTVMVGIGCLIYLLSARLVWLHYYILIIPAAMFILRPENTGYRKIGLRNITIRRLFGSAVIIAVAINPLQTIFGIKSSPYDVTLMLSISTFTLFLLTMWEFENIRFLQNI
jgi:hypothetical protein